MADKTGLWIIGARGAVATAVAVGTAALARNKIASTGLVTALPLLRDLPLPGWGDLVIGGHEIRPGSLLEEAQHATRVDRYLEANVVSEVADELQEIDSRIRPGIAFQSGEAIDPQGHSLALPVESPRAGIEQIKQDLAIFQSANDLSRVVVVLLASTEPETILSDLPDTWRELAPLLDTSSRCPLRASSLYAIATLEMGFSFVNFTPSLGSDCEPISQLALDQGACHAGRDGKTGETLLKTVLAPMFAARNLEVMSWVGHNILGNADGRVLDYREHKQTKVQSKSTALSEMLGYDPQSLVSIEYIKSLGDWKTAWDHVHFKGFLGAPMSLQFTWQGCDSALAAPLVLDLVRLVDHANCRGETGTLGYLSSFFKSPMNGPDERSPAAFYDQLADLADYAQSCREPSA